MGYLRSWDFRESVKQWIVLVLPVTPEVFLLFDDMIQKRKAQTRYWLQLPEDSEVNMAQYYCNHLDQRHSLVVRAVKHTTYSLYSVVLFAIMGLGNQSTIDSQEYTRTRIHYLLVLIGAAETPWRPHCTDITNGLPSLRRELNLSVRFQIRGTRLAVWIPSG